MEENINQVSGVEQKTATPQPEVKAQPIDNSAENTLTTIAKIVLVCGIIATVICLFTACFVQQIEVFVITIMVLFSSLISWSLMKVLANISITLKEINQKIK